MPAVCTVVVSRIAPEALMRVALIRRPRGRIRHDVQLGPTCERALFLALLAFLIVVAWAFVFLHAGVTIILFFAGLIALGVNAITRRFLARAAAREARRSLEAHACPVCGADVDRNADDVWQCLGCGAGFLSSGCELETR